MVYIYFHPEDDAAVHDEIVPLLSGRDYKLVNYPNPETHPGEDGFIITYLNDKNLKKLLPEAAKNNWEIGILPHPGNLYTTKGLGISSSLKEAMEEILQSSECQKLDLLFCNDIPVFQAVNIGNVFIFSEEKKVNKFFSEVIDFFKNIKRISGLNHDSYLLTSNGEKIIHTSALGIIVVEHSLSSVVARHLVAKSYMNDGMFNVLILSPENLLQLFLFLLRGLFPKVKGQGKLPPFIGQIRTSSIEIKSNAEIEYTIDGEKDVAEEIRLEVQPEALVLKQASIYCQKEKDPEIKKSLITERLPTGEKRKELSKHALPLLPRATAEEFKDLFKVLRENSKTSAAFVVMMILSSLISTFGLFGDSSPVIIGAMILAPIISPIVSFSMGMVRYDTNMLKQGIITILIGTAVSLAFSAGVSLIIPLKIITSEIDARLTPTLLDLGIAVASGVAAAYAHAEESIAKSLAGVAIAVALVPPLSVAGIGLGWWDWEVFSGAFLLYLTNLAGIIMFAGLTFLLLGFAPFRRARMGLVYTLLLVILVMVPLSLSFNRIKQEASITRKLEGLTLNEVILRDVKVRHGDPIKVSLILVGTENLSGDELNEVKREIEKEIDQPIRLEVVSAREF